MDMRPRIECNTAEIYRLRMRAGLSLPLLAQSAGLSANCIHRIEKGHRTPRVTTIAKIAAALGVKVEDLLVEVDTEAISA